MRRFILSGLIFFLATSLMYTLFSYFHNARFSYKALILHENILFLIAVAAVIVFYAIRRFSGRNKVVLVLTDGATFSAIHLLLLFYALLFLSSHSWRELPSLELVLSHSAYLPELLSALPLSAISIAAVVLAYLLFLTFTCYLFIKYGRNIVSDFLDYVIDGSRGYAYSAAAGGALAILALSLALALIKKQELIVHQEPIAIFFHGVEYQGQKVSLLSADELKNNEEYLHQIGVAAATNNIQRKNVVLIIVDSLRADHLPMYGYDRNTAPFLNQLFAGGKLVAVDPVFSSSAVSFSGITGILSSKGSLDINNRNLTATDVFARAGYQTNLILSGAFATFYNLRNFLGTDVSHFSDGFDSANGFLNDDNYLLERLNHYVVRQPAFFFFHLMSVHQLGVVHDEFVKYQPAESHLLFDSNEASRIALRNNYDNGILQADNTIRSVFGYLEQNLMLDQSIVIITSDHGESLGEGRQFGHGSSIRNTQIRIPLLFYGLHDARVATPFATQLDIMCTVLDYLQMPIPDSWDGQSILRSNDSKSSHHVVGNRFYSTIAARAGGALYKYIYDDRTEQEELYNLTEDMDEAQDLSAGMTYRQILIELRQMTAAAFDLNIAGRLM